VPKWVEYRCEGCTSSTLIASWLQVCCSMFWASFWLCVGRYRRHNGSSTVVKTERGQLWHQVECMSVSAWFLQYLGSLWRYRCHKLPREVVKVARVQVLQELEYGTVFLHVFCKICFLFEYTGVTMSREQLWGF
jgi:hypothetical protein